MLLAKITIVQLIKLSMNIIRSLSIIFLCLLTLGCQNAKEEKVEKVTPDIVNDNKIKIPKDAEVKYTTKKLIFISSNEGTYTVNKDTFKITKISKSPFTNVIQNKKTGDILLDTSTWEHLYVTLFKKNGEVKHLPVSVSLASNDAKNTITGTNNIDFVISYSYSPKVDIIYTDGTTKTISSKDPKDTVKSIYHSSNNSIVVSYYRSNFIKVILQDKKVKTINNKNGSQFKGCENKVIENTNHNNNKDDEQDVHISAIKEDYIEIDRNNDNSIKIKTPQGYSFDKIYSGSLSGNIVIMYSKNSYNSHESYITVLNKDNKVKSYKVDFNKYDLVHNIRSTNFNNIVLIASRTIDWKPRTEFYIINKDGDLNKIPLIANYNINDIAYNTNIEKLFISFEQISSVEVVDLNTASIKYIPGVNTTNWSSDLDNPKNSYTSEYFIVNYAHEGVIVVSKDKFIRPRINKNLDLMI